MINGIKIPLAIDSGIIIAGFVVAIGMYYKVISLADDVEDIKQERMPTRVILLEQDLKHTKRAVDRIEVRQKEQDAVLKKIERQTRDE